MKKILILLILISVFSPVVQSTAATGEVRYWVFFTDKGDLESLSKPALESMVRATISERAWQRRQKRVKSLYKQHALLTEDLPLFQDYIQHLRQIGFRIHQKSRWFNAISGYAPGELLKQIDRLPFVKSIEKVKTIRSGDDSIELNSPESHFDKNNFSLLPQLHYGPSFTQVNFHSIPELHEQGLSGGGVLVGMFDTGFNLDHPALRHLIPQIVAEWDFVNGDSVTKNEPGDPSGQESHGTATLSTIAGMDEGELIGPAFNASFVLAKTEAINFERHVEEDNWAAAAEWADSIGVDIVSTSLGYSDFEPGEPDYTYQDMDGETTIITRAANFLTDRGVLVVASAGNEGGSKWHFITAPADGKKVITVGAVNSDNQVASFSSRGPTFDGRIKPDVVGIGVGVRAANASNQQYFFLQGTSLSAPMISGICALVLEKHPGLSVDQMLEIIHRSGDNSGTPDFDRGWGKVDAVKALEISDGVSRPVSAFSVMLLGKDPFDATVTFGVGLPNPSPVTITIYNIMGQQVKSMHVNGYSGINPVLWDGRNEHGNSVATGVYVFRAKSNFGIIHDKFVMIR
ncbi:MAG: S8 family serine peptidase [Calditrichia bacterium]